MSGVIASSAIVAELVEQVAVDDAAIVGEGLAVDLPDLARVAQVLGRGVGEGDRVGARRRAVVVWIIRRSSTSAILRVRPSRVPGSRTGPSLRWMRRSPIHHCPYQEPRRMRRLPVPYERR